MLVTTCGQTPSPSSSSWRSDCPQPSACPDPCGGYQPSKLPAEPFAWSSLAHFCQKQPGCEDLLFELFKLSLLILTRGTADRVVVGGGAVICPTALDVNTCSSEDERTVKPKVYVLLHDQRGASLTISQGVLAAHVVLYLQAVMEGNDCKSSELKYRKATNCLCFQTERLRHTTFPRAAWGGCGGT